MPKGKSAIVATVKRQRCEGEAVESTEQTPKSRRQASGSPVREELEDAPADSPAHERVRWQGSAGLYLFDIKRDNGDRVRLQTTVVASGGCKETAARIARLCYVMVEQGADREEVLEYRNKQYRKLQGSQPSVKDLYQPVKDAGGVAQGQQPSCSSAAPGSASPLCGLLRRSASELAALAEEDAPLISRSHKGLNWAGPRYEGRSGLYWFEVERSNGERVRCQTTVAAAGGCREAAARIARLVYWHIECGATREEALKFRDKQYQKALFVQSRQLGCRDVRDIFRKFSGEEVQEAPEVTPEAPESAETPESSRTCERSTTPNSRQTTLPGETPQKQLLEKAPQKRVSAEAQVQKLAPQVKQRVEMFRNLRGEVVSVKSNEGCQKVTKPWSELEPSDVDFLSCDDIYSYEKELNLKTMRTFEQRVARLEQLAQRTTLRGCGTRALSSQGSALDEALAGMAEIAAQEEGRGFDAQFLQIFLALSPQERRQASLSEVSCLERVARIEDGSKMTMSERRTRLKEVLWEMRSASGSKASGFLEAWAKPTVGGGVRGHLHA